MSLFVRGCLASLAWLSIALAAQATVLLTENAENGLGGVTPHTTGGYPLIESDFASQGANSFHLANPAFADNWFELNPTVTIQADSKLFFQSQLGFVASGQTVLVQMSTNGGATWPTTLYSKVGTSTGSSPVDGAFVLRTVDLSPYASQNAKFRFYLDYTPGGSAFTQTDAGVGWYIDDIQIADQLQKTQYSIGDPSADEQLYLEYINRSRANALVEANRLKNETNSDITSAYSFFGVNPQNIVDQFSASISSGLFPQQAQPLSFNPKLITAARLHTQDQFNNQFQGHVSSNNPPAPFQPGFTLGDRLDAVGYNGAAGENVYANADSVEQGHAAFEVDWGNVSNPGDPNYNPAFAGQGMQDPAGHRLNLHDPDFKEIGVGVINGTNGSVGPQLVTEDFGNPGAATFVTGVVYQDLNHNTFYDIGEGRSGIRIDVAGSAYYAISSTSGGYSVPVSGDGAYPVSFTGGGFAPFSTMATIAGGLNMKIDDLVAALPVFAADFDHDGDVDGADLAKWRGDFHVTAGSDADGDGDSDGADFLEWQRELGSGSPAVASAAAVPEPRAIWLLLGACPVVMLCGRRRP